MSPRTGRPKAAIRKDIRFSIRLDSEESQKLTNYCEKHGISKGEAIRRGICLLIKKK
jgi:predicted DNA-binding protein